MRAALMNTKAIIVPVKTILMRTKVVTTWVGRKGANRGRRMKKMAKYRKVWGMQGMPVTPGRWWQRISWVERMLMLRTRSLQERWDLEFERGMRAVLMGFGLGETFSTIDKGLWKVRTIVDDHNHDLVAAMFSYLLPSHRKMRNSDKAQVDSMKQFGIPTFKIMAYMAGQFGRYGMLRFTKRYLYNYVHGQRAVRISDGDAAATISYLEGNADADLRTVAHYMCNAENCLGSLFWADGKMVSDYHLFRDVVAFDSTYKSNKYKKPLVVFSGTNHHKQKTIFGFALLEDEEVHSYR
ncbi:hypothetical protein AHAS_Ahas09G0236700 [Arachis hypogaea]